MANPGSSRVPNPLSLNEFLQQLSGLSFDVTPELDEIQAILRSAEAREHLFAARLETLKQQILQMGTEDNRRDRLTHNEEKMVELITLFQTIVMEKERAAALQEEVADKIVQDLMSGDEAHEELSMPLAQDYEPDAPSYLDG